MIVPEYWAEARIQKRLPDRQVTVRRFGWSDVSHLDAERHADERVKEAFARIVSGEKLPRREKKVRYNGSDGLPIREEIIERVGDSVVTRNSYGARCLNTPDVFFADVDFPDGPFHRCGMVSFLFGMSAVFGVAVGRWFASFGAGFIAAPMFAVLIFMIYGGLHRVVVRLRGGQERIIRQKIVAFAGRRQDWHLRVYRTPNGFRLLALHKTFDPRSKEVEDAFRVLGVDRTYAVMCQKQNCFRARLTAKPWRVGITEHLKPRPGVWPIKESRIPERRIWVEEYESTAQNFAACRFVMSVGAGHLVAPRAQEICDFHDDSCCAQTERPLA